MTLEKAEPGVHWPALFDEGMLQGHTHMPLSEGMDDYEELSVEELKQLKEKIAVMSNTGHDDKASEKG